MRRNMISISTNLVAVAFQACLWAGPILGTTSSIAATREAENPLAHEIIVTGTVITDREGSYYIRGQSPKEVFRIINPVPEILDRAIAGGKPVKIEARIVQGDNLVIERIDGITYQRDEPGER